MRRLVPLLLATTLFAAFPAAAQNAVPEIPFDSVANPLTLPDDIYLGEIGGVAANSKGDIFVYTRTGHPTVSLGGARDRKSTRLNSSHGYISYAVFCLKKKKKQGTHLRRVWATR